MTKKLKPLCLRGKKQLTYIELYELAKNEIKEWKKFLKDIKTMRLKNKKCKKT